MYYYCPECNTTLLVKGQDYFTAADKNEMITSVKNGIFVDALETFAKEISEHVGHSVKKEDIHYIE